MSKGQKMISSYKQPINGLDFVGYSRVIRDISKNVLNLIMDDGERKQCGPVQVDNVWSSSVPLFINDCFIGTGPQENLVFPAGGNDVRISDRQYRMFVVPNKINSTLYETGKDYILDKK